MLSQKNSSQLTIEFGIGGNSHEKQKKRRSKITKKQD